VLELDFKVWNDEKRYVRDPQDAGEALEKGKVLLENVRVSIRRNGSVVYDETFRGHRPRKAEAFDPKGPRDGAYAVRRNAAEVDLLAVCDGLMRPFSQAQLEGAKRSKSKYISAVAAGLLDEPIRAHDEGGERE
jgi:hypothetical protein